MMMMLMMVMMLLLLLLLLLLLMLMLIMRSGCCHYVRAEIVSFTLLPQMMFHSWLHTRPLLSAARGCGGGSVRRTGAMVCRRPSWTWQTRCAWHRDRTRAETCPAGRPSRPPH
uniref:Putative secreted protein n=1 Tax=Anopheles darlingi TaxID=43151 RepID=A0A2M4DDR0_ANODA